MNESQRPPSLIFSLIGTAHAIEARMEEALEQAGLSLAKFSLLDHLARTGIPLTLGELAEKSSCVKSNITQLIDRLEADALVRRVPDAEDRRVTRAELTELGRERQEQAAVAVRRIQEECLASLPAGDQASLGWALRRLG